MLETNVQDLAVANNQMIAFNANALQMGNCVSHTAGSTVININRAGVYSVEFNAYGSSTEAGTIGVQLMLDDTVVANGVAESATGAGEIHSISFQALLPVTAVCRYMGGKKLEVKYTGTAGTLNFADITLTKIK